MRSNISKTALQGKLLQVCGKSVCLLLLLFSCSGIYGQQVVNLDTIVPSRKQALVVDYLSEGAGASAILGYFFLDIDTDKDGTPDFSETASGADLDGDGLPNSIDPDDDNDGILDGADVQPAGVTSMPASYFQNGSTAAANGNTSGDYWQFVPNKVRTSGPYSGYYEHPGAYLYIDNNANNVPDVLEYTIGANLMPPYTIDKGTPATHITAGSYLGLLGEFEYSGSPGQDSVERSHRMGSTIFYICDDDNGTGQTNHYTNHSPYGSAYSDSKASTNAQPDYDIYETSLDSSTLIPQEIVGPDAQSEQYYKYRWFDGEFNEKREMVFFIASFWGSGGAQLHTFYSKPEFNADNAPNSPSRNGSSDGDDFGGWAGKTDWFPHFQNTSDHNQLAAAVFGTGTVWTDIATAPTNGSSPVAVNPADQAWVDMYENWTTGRRIVQYRAVGNWLNTTAVNANSIIQGRYGYDLTADGQHVIIRAVDGKMPHFMVVNPDGDPSSFIIGSEDLFGGGDRDFEDEVFYLTALDSVNMTATLKDSYNPGICSDTIRYSVTIRNSGLTTATNVQFGLTPDANTSLITGSVSTSSGSVFTGNGAGHSVVLVSIGSMAICDSVQIRFEVTVNNGAFPGVSSISCQGMVGVGNYPNFPTSDPEGTQYFQPTATDLNLLFTPLTMSCPANQAVAFDAACAYVLPDYASLASSTDFCSSFGVSQSPVSGTAITSTTTITLTGFDALGRSGNCSFDVVPSDQTGPVIICPAHLHLSTQSHTLADYTASAVVSDNCSGSISVTQSPTAGTVVNAESNIVILTADDGNGNTTNCEFVVNLLFPSQVTLTDHVFVGLQNGAYLVLGSDETTAIKANGTTPGHLESEGENNVVKWNIGNNTGDFTVPFSTKWSTSAYIPLTVSISAAGSTNGSILFSTYETATDLNTPFASGVTNMNFPTAVGNGALLAVDRFWRIDASSYSSKPDVNLTFTYDDAANEIGGTNTLLEGNLSAYWYDDGVNQWQGPQGAADVNLNTVSGISIPASDFFETWTLVDKGGPLPATLGSFEAHCSEEGVEISWVTLSENQSHAFILEKSTDGAYWKEVARTAAMGELDEAMLYQLYDRPTNGQTVYYQLQLVDKNGQRSALGRTESFCEGNTQISLYPNPTHGQAFLEIFSPENQGSTYRVVLFDMFGHVLQRSAYPVGIGSTKVELAVDSYAAGMYIVKVMRNGKQVYMNKLVKRN